jgi:hypothetical protein
MMPNYMMAMGMMSKNTATGSLAPEKASDAPQRQKTRQGARRYYLKNVGSTVAYIYRRNEEEERYVGLVSTDIADVEIDENPHGVCIYIYSKREQPFERRIAAAIWVE